MSTFDGQSSLPKLPIPPLEDTCKRYILAVTPLLTKQELATTTAAVERFLATDGPALQNSLCEYAADKSSYIEDFWFDAYLSGSSSVVLNINPYFVLEDDPTPSNNDQVNRAAPHHIGWRLTPQLQQAVRFAEVRLSDLVHQNETCTLDFTGFGKAGIVEHQLSPDAFVQLAMMAAYYELFGRVVCVYEPVQTKSFLHGRTEAARTMTVEAAHFVRTWTSRLGDDAKVAALEGAVQSLAALVKLAAKGLGVDRHLYALYCTWRRAAAEGAPPPSLFADHGWAALNHTTISTSNCGNPALRLFGFGPVVADGFGIGYIIKDECISFCAASKHRQTERFLHTLSMTLAAMQASLSKVRALRKESAVAHDYNDYGGPTCGGGEDSPAAQPQLPPRPGRELGTKRRR